MATCQLHIQEDSDPMSSHRAPNTLPIGGLKWNENIHSDIGKEMSNFGVQDRTFHQNGKDHYLLLD